MDQVAFDVLFPTLEQALGNNLIGAYVYPGRGGGYFDPRLSERNLLLVIADNTSLHDMRDAFLSVWSSQGKSQRGPIVTTRAAIQRHLRLNQLFAYHLYRHGERLTGDSLFGANIQDPHQLEQLAYLCSEAIEASVAVAPDLLPPEVAAEAHERLYHLAAHLTGTPPDDDASASDLLALVQVQLREQIGETPAKKWSRTAEITSVEEPNLEAMLEDREHLLVIVPPLAHHLLREIDWVSITKRMPKHLTRIAVTTASQLILTVQSERALDFVLSTYKLVWGTNPLSGINVSARAVFRQAARNPSRLLVDGLPYDYLLASDEEAVHKVIHDYQNRLLNLRLEHELLQRLFDIDRAEPPEPLPRRDEPFPNRVDAIYSHLNWWAGYYANKMLEWPAENKMSPV